MDRRNHFDFRIVTHLPNELVEQSGIDQRFVALDVEHESNASKFGCDLADPVSPGGVFRIR
jgi:hypothetical protein